MDESRIPRLHRHRCQNENPVVCALLPRHGGRRQTNSGQHTKRNEHGAQVGCLALHHYSPPVDDFSDQVPHHQPANLWAKRDSNPRLPACKAGALDQLSYSPAHSLSQSQA